MQELLTLSENEQVFSIDICRGNIEVWVASKGWVEIHSDGSVDWKNCGTVDDEVREIVEKIRRMI